MKLLIVDDEESVIYAVIKGVQWKTLNFNGVYTAHDIEDAKEKIETYHIDVLLSDIEMPMGTGLELLEWVNEYHSGICCVFMTCHAEFSFAQKALHLGSFDYILKPLNFTQLEQVLGQAILKVEQEKRMKQASDCWESGRKAVEKQFWRGLFIGDIAINEKSIQLYLERNQLGIPIDGCFIPILISPKVLPANITPEESKILGFSLRNVAEEIFYMKSAKHGIETLSENKVLVILTIKEDTTEDLIMEEIAVCCNNLMDVGNQYLQMQLCCYVGEPVSICKVPQQIEQLLGLDFNNVISYRMLLYSGQEDYFHNHFQYMDYIHEKYREHSGSYAKIVSDILELFIKRKEEFVLDKEFMEQFVMGFYYMLNEFSRKNQVFLGNIIDVDKNVNLLHKAEQSMTDLMEWVQYIGALLQEYERADEKRETPVDEVKEYIRSHLNEEISVEKIAEYVHLNPDYLNRLFKKETGMSLGKYATIQKMERAKWLLRHTKWQIGEVAAAVGYYNYSSFNRSFGKVVGKSPQEWKMDSNK